MVCVTRCEKYLYIKVRADDGCCSQFLNFVLRGFCECGVELCGWWCESGVRGLEMGV